MSVNLVLMKLGIEHINNDETKINMKTNYKLTIIS